MPGVRISRYYPKTNRQTNKHTHTINTRLPEAQWIERPTGVRNVVGSIPFGGSYFFAGDKLIIPSLRA